MNPLTAIELEIKTIAELLVLAKLIETLIAENEEGQPERAHTFVNRELVRRELGRKRGWAR